MDHNPTESEQTCRNPDKTITIARFRRAPGPEAWKPRGEMPHKSSCGISECLNCPWDNQGTCGSCSATSAASLAMDTSTVTVAGGQSARSTRTLDEGEGSEYKYNASGRQAAAGFMEIFQKPSTTTAMTLPGAEESTVYNGKIGCLLLQGNQPCTNQTIRSETIFTESIHREGVVDFGKLASTSSTATEEGSNIKLYDKQQDRSKRRKREKEAETERVAVRVGVADVNSPVPPDPNGYIWWKYGEKKIKGYPYPRSYYRCKSTRSDNCPAKRQVIRAADEPWIFDITYKGTHTHAASPLAPAASSSIDQPSTCAPPPAGTVPGETNFTQYL